MSSVNADFFFSLVLNSPIKISVVDDTGTWLWSFNDSPRLLDPDNSNVSTADQEKLALVVRSVATGAQDNVCVRVHVKDREGVWRPHIVTVKDMKQEPAVKAIGLFAYEISEQETIEHRVELLDSSINALIEHVTVAVLLHDTDHNVVYVNQLFMDLFKVSDPIESVIGQPVINLYPVARVRFLSQAASDVEGYSLIAAGEECLGKEWVTTDGKIICRDYIPVKVHGEIKGHLWMFRDVTPT